jgi:polyhydroxyalkanoate synthase subunit PhaC
MADQQPADMKLPDPVELSHAMARIAEQSQRLVADFLQRQASGERVEPVSPGMSDPLNIGRAFLEMTTRMMTNPAKLVEAQVNLWHDYMQLWQSTAQRLAGNVGEPVIAPTPEDRRFSDSAWQENQLFDFIKQSYLLSARWLQSTVRSVEGLDPKTAKKVDFYTRQFVDAMAPSNFVLTNPEVLRKTLETGGENLVKGLENLLEDLDRGKGQLQIKMTDSTAFEVGRNVAITPGKVVFQNDLMQLLQYDPSTPEVAKRPVLIIPPWINKYYILDLREKNSFIRWAVGEGLTVFVISWVNPEERLARKTFDDYMVEGPLAAIDAIEQATGQPQVNAVGYCLGGTLLACTLAYMAAKKMDRVASGTFLTTLVDFTEPGELGVFIDEEQLKSLESRMKEKGYLDGSAMATTFNMLRANDLIWSFVVNNYLLGKEPFPFDLLYWNADSTRMPAAMHSYYLRKMYQENLLSKPGGISLKKTPIDLGKIKIPSFILSTKEDHIAPWKSTYAAVRLFQGPMKFVLAASGHVAGVVNPPASGKYHHWINDKSPSDPDLWLNTARAEPGSWWPSWSRWLEQFADGKVPARWPGEGRLKPIEDAPGSYVKVRAQDA